MLPAFLFAVLFCSAFVYLGYVAKQSKNKAVRLRQSKARDDIAVRELGFWELVWELSLMYFIRWSRPTYVTSFNWATKYGPITAIKFRKILPFYPRDYVNCNDLETSKEIMTSSNWPDKFYDNHYLFKTSFNKPYGVLFGSGKYHKSLSKLALKLLHQFEFFKPARMEGLVAFEATEVETELEKRVVQSTETTGIKGMESQGDLKWLTFCPHTMFERNTLNVIWQIVCGSRFEKDDPLFEKMMELQNRANRAFVMPNSILEVLPFLKHIPALTFLGPWYDCSHFYYNIFRKIIARKRQDLGRYQHEPKDIVDGFILEIDKKQEGKDCVDEYMNDEQLLTFMRDMVFGGSDTVNSGLEHAIFHMTLNPHVQTRVQVEIDSIIGHDRAPVYADKARMPYTEATLLEILRLAAPVPATLRTAKSGCKLGTSDLKKGSVVAVNIYGIHRSKELWDDPEVFRPERFLDSQNNLVNTDKIIPFGYGRRGCLGESPAKVAMFMFFVTIFRKFTFQVSDSHSPPSFENVHGMSRCPQPYFVKVAARVPSQR